MSKRRTAGVACLILATAAGVEAQESALRQAARLDQAGDCRGAERIYQQALSQGPGFPALWNNLGNHYLLCGEPEKARSYFERVLQANPGQAYANLQLARIAVNQRQGARALEYLARVSDSQPATRMLRAEALHLAGQPAAALAMLDGVEKEAAADPRLEYLYGVTSARMGAYERAVRAFNAVLAAHPNDFEVLLSLGRAAARAKLYDRAREALEAAVRLQPGNVDALVELAEVHAARGEYARAIYLLVQAQKLAPGNAEIPLALARAAQDGGFYGDAALAYDEYLRLKPDDDAARRDRGLACGLTDTRQAEGLTELRWYIRKYPGDALGYHHLAQLTWRDRPQQALEALATAVRLDPRLTDAQVDLGWLLNRQGRTAEAVPHFEKALEIHPRDVRALDQLGAAYLALDKPAEAVKALRRATAISPGDRQAMLNLGRALIDAGQEEEGRRILSRFQKASPARVRGPWREPGMIAAAGMAPEERTRFEIERLQRESAAHADDPELQLRLASLLLAAGRGEEADAAFRVLLTRTAENRIWQEAGSYLLSFEQYALAREFLARAASGNPTAFLDLATATFYLEGAAKALATLERVPEAQRAGDYLLLKAKLLDAAGRGAEAEKSLEQGLGLAISRPQIAREAALMLVQHGRNDLALEFLAKAAGDNPDLRLIRAIVFGLAGRGSAAEKAVREIESGWPEWDRPYVVDGLLLEKTRPEVARQKLETAIALGSQDAAARCTLALLKSGVTSGLQCGCAGGLREELFPRCGRP